MKSWLAQGSSGRRVTLLPGTTFLHINGALQHPRICRGVHKLQMVRIKLNNFRKLAGFHFSYRGSNIKMMFFFSDLLKIFQVLQSDVFLSSARMTE